MSVATMERPMSAQERVLASNNPPPLPPSVADISHRSRAAVNTRGTGVAKAMRPNTTSTEETAAPPPRPASKVPLVSPSEFLAGPKEPGHVKHGVRRYEEKETTVGKALTEEWILGRKEDDPTPRFSTRQRGPKDNLEGLCCSVKTEEVKPRPQRGAGMAPPHTTTAPYSEPEIESNIPPSVHTEGKRRFKTVSNVNLFGGETSPRKAENEALQQQHTPGHTTRNKRNISHDVLNLGRYSAEELNEVERKGVYGPREFTPAALPPRQRPLIARVKTSANETHDIFGTGKGVTDTEPVHCKNPGASAPRRTGGANIFAAPEPDKKPAKPYRASEFLSYEEANVEWKGKKNDNAIHAARPASAEPHNTKLAGKVDQGSLFNSKSPEVPNRVGRSRGVYAPPHKANNIY